LGGGGRFSKQGGDTALVIRSPLSHILAWVERAGGGTYAMGESTKTTTAHLHRGGSFNLPGDDETQAFRLRRNDPTQSVAVMRARKIKVWGHSHLGGDVKSKSKPMQGTRKRRSIFRVLLGEC